jgi:hypothetical protein
VTGQVFRLTRPILASQTIEGRKMVVPIQAGEQIEILGSVPGTPSSLSVRWRTFVVAVLDDDIKERSVLVAA